MRDKGKYCKNERTKGTKRGKEEGGEKGKEKEKIRKVKEKSGRRKLFHDVERMVKRR